MTATRTVTVTTTRISNTVLPRRLNQGPAQNRSAKVVKKSGTTGAGTQNDKHRSSQYNIQKREYPSTVRTRSVKQASAGSPNDQARRKSSSGSSGNLTGSSSSRGRSGSNHSVHFTQSTKPYRGQSFVRNRSLGSDFSVDSKVEQIIQSLPGSFPKTPRRRQKPKITIVKPFNDFGVSNRRLPINIIEGRMEASSVQPDIQLRRVRSGTIKSSSPTGLRKDSSSHKTFRLSPRSLRRARLMILDKQRNPSPLDFVPQLENDRRGSTLLPRQHYCEPNIRGHYSVQYCQTIGAIHTKHGGSPDPNSPHGDNGATSAGHNQRRRSCESHFRIANMRVAEILQLRAKKSHHVEIIQTSRLRKIPLDDVTEASVEGIVRRKRGRTLVGVGPWAEIISGGDNPVWNNWCCLSSYPLTVLGSSGTLPAWTEGASSEGVRARQSLYGTVILVPLTDAQATLLSRALE